MTEASGKNDEESAKAADGGGVGSGDGGDGDSKGAVNVDSTTLTLLGGKATPPWAKKAFALAPSCPNESDGSAVAASRILASKFVGMCIRKISFSNIVRSRPSPSASRRAA